MRRRGLFCIFALTVTALVTSCASNTQNNNQNNQGDTNINQDSDIVNVAPTFLGMTVLKNTKAQNIVEVEPVAQAKTGFVGTLEKDIEDLVNIEIKGDDELKFIINPSEVFTIALKFDNPSKVNIESFTLNNKKWTSVNFLKESTAETVYINLNAPTKSGYYDYIVDQIKYLENGQLKDVEIKGDTSTRAGIAYSSRPGVQVKNEVVNSTSFSMDLTLEDPEGVIKDNIKRVYLSDGTKIVATKDLAFGLNKIQFDNLEMNKTYQYGVFGVFDMIDGQDLRSYTLKKSSFITTNGVNITNINSTKNDVAFDIDNPSGSTIKKVSLLKKTETSFQEVETLKDIKLCTFSNLLSNNNYAIRVDFTYKANEQDINGFVQEEFATKELAEPTIAIQNVSATKTTINYNFDYKDDDKTCTSCKVNLYKDDTLVATNADITVTEFTGLSPNSNYTLKLVYGYDLNDGVGVRNRINVASIRTLNKSQPIIDFVDVKSTKTSIIYNLDIKDYESVLTDYKVELLSNDVVVGTVNKDQLKEFQGLNSGKLYDLKLTYTFDLGDGVGVQNKIAIHSIKTLENTVPSFGFANVRSTQTAISFEYQETDNDTTLVEKNVELYKGQTLVSTITDMSHLEFNDLLSGTTYRLRLNYKYDLNDGNGVNSSFIEQEVTTNPKGEPTLTLENIKAGHRTISYTVNKNDYDNTYVRHTVELYQYGTLVSTNTNLGDGEFTGLLSGSGYNLCLTYYYNANDGFGERSKTINSEYYYTEKYKTPYFNFQNPTVTDDSVKGELSINDIDKIGNVSSIQLLENDVVVQDMPYPTTSYEFTGLKSFTNYTLKVNYSYDLNNGYGNISTSSTHNFKTNASANATNVTLLNTTAISEGETIHLQLDIDNPNGYKYTKVMINGEEFPISSTSTDTKLYIDILNDEERGWSGLNNLTINKLYFEHETIEIPSTLKGPNQVSVTIHGAFYFESVKIVNQFDKEVDYETDLNNLKAVMMIKNDSGYNIDSITYNGNGYSYTLNSSDITLMNSNHEYSFKPQFNFDTWQNFKLLNLNVQNVSYSNATIKKELTGLDKQTSFYYAVNGFKTQVVNNYDDLMMLDNYYPYMCDLNSDIDLTGKNREGVPFKGVFKGNNHTIKGMSNVSSYVDRSVTLGFFSQIVGVVSDLIFTDVLIKAEAIGDGSYSANYGTICGYSTENIVNNILVDTGSLIELSGTGNCYGYGITDKCYKVRNCVNKANITSNYQVGGITDASIAINCVNYGVLSAAQYAAGIMPNCYGYNNNYLYGCCNYGSIKGQSSYSGGLVGYSSYGIIENSSNYGVIYCSDAGGLVGHCDSGIVINNSINYNDSRNASSSGFIGYAYNANLKFKNCLSIGVKPNAYQTYYPFMNVYYNPRVKLINCYALEGLEINDSHKNLYATCTIEQLNDQNFYTQTLGWNPMIWNLNNLDYNNKIFPTII